MGRFDSLLRMPDDTVRQASVAYLILGHQRPDQVARLAWRIAELSADARILIHWDGSSDEPAPIGLPPTAAIARRSVRTDWGRWSLVEATLALLEEAMRAEGPRWFVVVSGQDWPVRDLARWERELDRTGADALVESQPVSGGGAAGHPVSLGADEVRRYRDAWQVVRRPAAPLAARLGDAVARRASAWAAEGRYPALMDFYGRGYALAWRRREFPMPEWVLHKGHQWMTLGPAAARALVEAPPEVVAHFRRALIPDESFAHTVLRNQPTLRLAAGLTSYAPWERFDRTPPLVLRDEDLDRVRASGAPFARKIGDGDLAAVTRSLDGLVESETEGRG